MGDVDFVFIDSIGGKGYVVVNLDMFKLVGELMGLEDFGFIFFKGFDFVELFNVVIVSMCVDGIFEKINIKWFFDYKVG